MRLDSGNFTPDQVEWVARQLEDWTPTLALTPPPSEGAPFFVDLTGTAGLRRRDRAQAGGRVLFLDAGNVWPDPSGFNAGDLRYAIGPGLRYQTPIGPLRLDVGYQINPIPGLNSARILGPRTEGLYREGEDLLYVSRGLGVVGLPIRIAAAPEIVILTLKRG